MAIGIVKHFNPLTGCGIITPEHRGDNLYARACDVMMSEPWQLKAGQRVSYTRAMDDDGLQAKNIQFL
ncbi:cold shock domain-containing protein [Neisseriaceae bacterium TC5R-5]|nr:cold shock domain-containing protein [Neisseriaceae bacterium TC5R-5]